MMELVTYLSDAARAGRLLDAGAGCLLLDDPAFSLQASFDRGDQAPEDDSAVLLRVEALILGARQACPAETLVFNLDLVPFDRDYPRLTRLFGLLCRLEIFRVRVSCPGLGLFVRESMPGVRLELHERTRNSNFAGAAFFASPAGGGFARQVLSSEISLPDAEKTVSRVKTRFELHAHGPVLLQHSLRDLGGAGPMVSSVRPGRELDFCRNAHGHFIYHWFVRSLLDCVPEVLRTGVGACLIDCRRFPPDVALRTVALYRRFFDACLSGPQNFIPDRAAVLALERETGKPFRRGFSRANRSGFSGPEAEVPAEPLGRVVDVAREKMLTLRLEPGAVLEKGAALSLLTPSGERLACRADPILDLDNLPVGRVEAPAYAKIPWVKRAVPQSLVYKQE